MAKKTNKNKKVEPEKEVAFKYIFEDDYHPDYVSGAFGGSTPRGEIVLNFYFERRGIPYKEVFNLTEKGTLEENAQKREPEDFDSSFIRQITTGVIMSHQTAREIQNYLNKVLVPVEEVEEGKE